MTNNTRYNPKVTNLNAMALNEKRTRFCKFYAQKKVGLCDCGNCRSVIMMRG
jgi:hypothetical protein